MPNTVTLRVQHDTGIPLAYISSALLEDVLRRSLLLSLERSVASMLGLGWDRDCSGSGETQSKARKFSPMEGRDVQTMLRRCLEGRQSCGSRLRLAARAFVAPTA